MIGVQIHFVRFSGINRLGKTYLSSRSRPKLAVQVLLSPYHVTYTHTCTDIGGDTVADDDAHSDIYTQSHIHADTCICNRIYTRNSVERCRFQFFSVWNSQKSDERDSLTRFPSFMCCMFGGTLESTRCSHRRCFCIPCGRRSRFPAAASLLLEDRVGAFVIGKFMFVVSFESVKLCLLSFLSLSSSLSLPPTSTSTSLFRLLFSSPSSLWCRYAHITSIHHVSSLNLSQELGCHVRGTAGLRSKKASPHFWHTSFVLQV